MTPQEIDRIECAIRHIQTATDVDPWACEIAVDAMRKQIADSASPCDLCVNNPPSSMDGKPCSYCPAEPMEE